MKNIFLSIIIPVYNVEKYIGECLDSLLNQDIDKTEYEIICVNDGSPDNSEKIIKNYAEKYSNIRLINKENGGVSSARNLGLKEAKGDYIWFVDGDDFVKNNILKFIKDLTLKQNITDVLIFNITKDRNVFYDGSLPYKINVISQNEAINGLFDFRSWNGYICNKIFKREKAKNIYLNENIYMIEDLEFYSRLFLNMDSFIYVNRFLYFYRVNGNSVSSSFNEKKLSSFIAYDLILNTLNDRDKYLLAYKIINSAKVDFSKQILTYYYFNDRKKYKNEKNKYKKIIKSNYKFYGSFKQKLGAILFLIFTKITILLRGNKK